MRTRLLLVVLVAGITAACGRDTGPEVRWADVEAARSATVANSASLEARQHYVEALSAYLSEHPGDGRATELYLAEELAYARSLIERGRLAAAIPYFEDALSRGGGNAALEIELAEVRSRIAVSRDRFEQLSRNMTRDEVRDLLGTPRPGWTHSIEKSGRIFETWYYKSTEGGLASVSFAGDSIHLAVYGDVLRLD